jgi:hypothetical protein
MKEEMDVSLMSYVSDVHNVDVLMCCFANAGRSVEPTRHMRRKRAAKTPSPKA